MADKDHHLWFTDRPQSVKQFKPQFKDEDIRSIHKSRIILGKDLVYVNCTLPKTADLPDKNTIAAVHQDLVNAQQLEASAFENHIPLLKASAENSFERAKKTSGVHQSISRFF